MGVGKSVLLDPAVHARRSVAADVKHEDVEVASKDEQRSVGPGRVPEVGHGGGPSRAREEKRTPSARG